MRLDRRTLLAGAGAMAALPAAAAAARGAAAAARGAAPIVRVATPMPVPSWALLQRRLIAAHTDACAAFFAKYVDDRGWLRVFERWGANDGPDDAAEATNDWMLVHALGGDDRVLAMVRRAWEGHLRQYTHARTVDVPFARRGMYHREFPVMMDWQHNAEGLTSFNCMGLSIPRDAKLVERTRRYADFYTGRDPTTGNYDAGHRLIRSMVNGSRGPMMRRMTPLDWAGDPFAAGARFHMEHGETTYAQTLAHYAEYGDVVGDNPLNLQSTTLGLNAYALGGDDRYRRWTLDYLDAWVGRARANGDLIPSNIGLDGTIGGSANGHWWGGVYGWGFSPVVPQTGKRENRNRVPRSITAFMNGTLLTGDAAYIDVWRRQRARINAAAKTIDGQLSTPTMYGADGWYGWQPGPHRTNGFEIWYITQAPADRDAAGDHPWVRFLEGADPAYPETALTADLANVAKRVAAIAGDETAPDTRLADWPLDYNPASVTSLVQLMTGGLHIARPSWSPTSPAQGGVPLHCRLRYFDPEARRAGVPDGVAALVHTLGDTATEVTLLNTDLHRARTLTVQGGAYAEHRVDAVGMDGRALPIGASAFTVRLEPGCGTRLRLAMRRYVNRPTLDFPWDRA